METLTSDTTRALNLGPNEKGVVVTQVEPGSLAARVGLRPGDVITRVAESDIESAGEFRNAIAQQDLAKGVLLHVKRDGAGIFVVLKKRR